MVRAKEAVLAARAVGSLGSHARRLVAGVEGIGPRVGACENLNWSVRAWGWHHLLFLFGVLASLAPGPKIDPPGIYVNC